MYTKYYCVWSFGECDCRKKNFPKDTEKNERCGRVCVYISWIPGYTDKRRRIRGTTRKSRRNHLAPWWSKNRFHAIVRCVIVA